jgi:GNAT superfamily N-acetyltransferase
VHVRRTSDADRSWIVPLLTGRWGATVVVSRGQLHDAAELPGFAAVDGEEPVGLLTYTIDDDELEVVSLDALRESAGVGTALLDAVRGLALAEGCRRVWLITTNDNLEALRFYQRRGFRLVAVHAGAIDRSRELKPQIPTVGRDGIPVHDEIELAYELGSDAPKD